MTPSRRANAIALAILAILPTLLFLDVLLGINSFYTRDITSYYYPAKKILREIVLGGHFPYWNPWFSAGQPMAANPEHEVFYPLTWLILLPRFDLAYHLLTLVHIYIALFAMYALLRSMALGRPTAVLGSLSFGLGGLLLSTHNLTPYLFSVAWMPLTCLYTRRLLLGGRSRIADRGSQVPPTTDNQQPATASQLTTRDSQPWWRGGLLRSAICDLRSASLASLFLGLQLLVGEPSFAIQSGILLGLYAIYRGIKDGQGLAATKVAVLVARRVAVIGAISVVALLIAAVQVLPALDHFGDSVRARGFDFYTVSYWSTPLARVAELVYPNIFGSSRLDGPYLYWGAALYGNGLRPFFLGIYGGLLVAMLVFGGMLARVRGWGLMLAIGGTSILFAGGQHLPLLRILYDSGAANWLRYPEKFVMLGVFGSVVYGAYVLEQLLRGDARVRKAMLWCTGATTLFALAAWLLTLTPVYEPMFVRIWSLHEGSALSEMVALSRSGWILAAARGLLLFLLLRNVQRIRRGVWLSLIGIFVVLDLGMMMPDLVPRVPSSFHRDPPAVERQFPANRDDFRIFHQAAWSTRGDTFRFYRRSHPDLYWTMRNSFGPMMPATWGLRIAMDADYDLTQLLPTADFTESAWELSSQRPRDWGDVIASMSNIWYVGIYRPPHEAIALSHGDPHQIQPVRFIERPHHPRYYFARHLVTIRDRYDFVRTLATTPDTRGLACIPGPAFTPAPGIVRRWRETPNSARIDVDTAGRAFLVMSVTPHKYWRITIDGQEADAVVTNIGYQGVEVPPGHHTVEMNYSNPLVAAGGAVSIATLLGLLLLARLGAPQPVIPSVERGTWAGGCARDEPMARIRAAPPPRSLARRSG